MGGIFSEVKTQKYKKFNSSRVRSLAAEVESNFHVHSSTETNDDIDAVLENLPVIYFSDKKIAF